MAVKKVDTGRDPPETVAPASKVSYNQVKDALNKVPPWGRVLIALIVGFGLVKFTPILEMLQLFFYIVLIPVLFAVCLGLVGQGTLQGFTSGWKATVDEINKRVSEKLEPNVAPE